MDYRRAILEALSWPCPGMTFNELQKYLKKHVCVYLSNKTLSKELKRLQAEGLITKGYQPLPDGKLAEIYTDPLNLKLGYILTEQDLKRVTFQKYRKVEAEFRRLAENVS
jgi:DNA-binding Lrp family transcriptional regulator